jgi:glucose-6-phosphate 1-dehydrogenase
VDHYLGKELVQNILFLRFANEIFSCGWNRDAIDSVQITVSESLGVEERASYYNKSGAIRDMLQNHLLQLLCFTAMEPPKSGYGNAVRDEAVKVISALRPPTTDDVVTGQYVSSSAKESDSIRSYRQENGVPMDSTTETYVAVRAFVDTPRWFGTPFYLRTGKRLDRRYAEIKVIFKEQFLEGLATLDTPNIIIIRIQPDEGIAIAFNVRKPGEEHESETVLMDFCHHCHFGPNTPEAYEAILASVILGEPLLFTRWDWLQGSWSYIDKLRELASSPVFYEAGSSGPKEADSLLEQDGRSWL